MANPEPQREIRIAPEGKSRHEILRRPRHPEYCETRTGLFNSAIVAQRNTVEFLQQVTGVDAKPLVAKFAEWEKSEATRPAESRAFTIAYFQVLAATSAAMPSDERRGALATVEKNSAAEQSVEKNKKRMALFQEALRNHLTTSDDATATAGILVGGLGQTTKLPEGFLDRFVQEVTPDVKEQQSFRAYLAAELFTDIHDNLILPGHKVARELDNALNHQPRFGTTDASAQRDIQAAKAEMQQILEGLPFMAPPLEPIQTTSDRLKLTPRLLQYFSALNWDGRLKQMVTVPYAARMKEITMPLFAAFN